MSLGEALFIGVCIEAVTLLIGVPLAFWFFGRVDSL
jgi:hypothetical protein